MRNILCLIGFAWLVPGFAQTQPTKTSFSLAEAQEYALVNGYTVTDKRLEYQKARKTIRETAAMGLPQISATGQYTYTPQIPAQALPDGTFGPEDGQPDLVEFGIPHQTVGTLSANQLIFDGSYFVALQATRVYKEIAQLDMNKAEIDIKADVANAYYGVLVAQEGILLAKENLKVVSENFNEVNELYKSGFVEEQDADQLELLMNNQMNQLANMQRQKNLAVQLLQFNMGMGFQKQIELTNSIEDLTSFIDNNAGVANMGAFSLEQHIDYRIAQNNFQAASLQLKNEKAAYLPSLSGFVQHTQTNFNESEFNAFNYNTYWVPGTSLGLSLNWTIFSGLARPARVQKAKIDVQRTQLAIDITENSLNLAYAVAQGDYQYALDNYATQKKNVAISKKIRDRTLIKFKEGLSSSLDLTQAENQLIATQSDYLQALQNLLTAKENVQLALGQQ
jgi:outer membrane protein